MNSSQSRRSETIVKKLENGKRGVIPTTFVPLAPDRILLDTEADLLFGLFHIMWGDMPRPKTYEIRLAEEITEQGNYTGCCLKLGHSSVTKIWC